MPRLRLASRSPRRADLLHAAGIEFELGPFPDVDESFPAWTTPEDAVRLLARRKADAVIDQCPGDVVLAADTLVFREADVLGKPSDSAHAVRMLRSLSGRTHGVCTGVALVSKTEGRSSRTVVADTTWVTFRELSDEEIDAYVATGEPLDKAGAYAIQGGASGFVAAIEGDRDNVVGLPIRLVRYLLDEHGSV